jgi:predicted PurR-regulated permease PerM
MSFWQMLISASIFSFIYTPIDDRFRRKKMKLWKRYLIAFTVGLIMLSGIIYLTVHFIKI